MKTKKILSFVVSLSLLPILGCGGSTTNTGKKDSEEKKAETVQTDAKSDKLDKSDAVHIKIIMTSGDEIEADLYPHIAPKSVDNFVNLIEKKFFDGLIFHRVIEGFMIQGGGYDESFYEGNFNSKETDTVKGEFESNGFTNNLKHTRGVLSMARTNDPNSASSQFFIMHQDSPHLDGEYAAFGEVTKGIEVVDKIASTKTVSVDGTVTYMGNQFDQQMDDVPKEPVVIKTIEIIE